MFDVVPKERTAKPKFPGLAEDFKHESKEEKPQTFGTKYV